MNKKKIYTLSYSNTFNPAPYLYKLDLHFQFTDKGVYLKYNKHFLNREDFSVEELEEDGFSTNDDVQIESTLSPVWANYFKRLIEHSKWAVDKPSEDIGNLLSLNTAEDNNIKYLTLNKVEYLLEEVYQAILETAEIEAPLSLYLKKIHNGRDKVVELIWYFKDRRFEVIPSQTLNVTWEDGQQWLSQFYEIELEDLPVHKKKIPEGKTCISPGDGLWYEIPNGKTWEKILSTLFSNR